MSDEMGDWARAPSPYETDIPDGFLPEVVGPDLSFDKWAAQAHNRQADVQEVPLTDETIERAHEAGQRVAQGIIELERLHLLHERVLALQEQIGQTVLAARDAGCSWYKIADALDMHQPTALRRYGPLVEARKAADQAEEES